MIKLAKPNISEKAIKGVVEVLKSGNLVQGEYVKKFENSLQRYLKANFAVVVSSGTSALHLSLIALDIQPGDEVIVPAFTFPATANAVELVGATPVFVDIDMDDFCIDPDGIEEKITTKTKAIIPVHEFGQSADIEKILEITRQNNLKIVEDAACALGSEFNGKKIGTFGELGCFSFHPRKAITTGEGGLIVTNNEKLSKRIQILRNHGISVKKGKTDFVEAGFNYRMTDFQAVLGCTQLDDLDDIIACRLKLSKIYDELLSQIDWIKTPKKFKNRKMIYQSYHILIDEAMKRDNVMAKLKKFGVETNIGAYALNCVSYYKKKYNLKDDDFPNAVSAYRKGLALPIGNHVGGEEIRSIAGFFKGLDNES